MEIQYINLHFNHMDLVYNLPLYNFVFYTNSKECPTYFTTNARFIQIKQTVLSGSTAKTFQNGFLDFKWLMFFQNKTQEFLAIFLCIRGRCWNFYNLELHELFLCLWFWWYVCGKKRCMGRLIRCFDIYQLFIVGILFYSLHLKTIVLSLGFLLSQNDYPIYMHG
jgi:hypothetical protein